MNLTRPGKASTSNSGGCAVPELLNEVVKIGHAVRYEIQFYEEKDKETYDHVISKFQENETEIEDSDFDKGGFIIWEMYHPYSFDVKKWLEDIGIKGKFDVLAWHLEREPDEHIEYEVV